MNRETYERLAKIDYSKVQKKISDLLWKYDKSNKFEKDIRIRQQPMQCDVMGFAGVIFFMMIGHSINSIDDYELIFEREISNELNLYGVWMSQEFLALFLQDLEYEEQERLFIELKDCANRMDYDELVAYILFGSIAEEDEYRCIKTPMTISRLVSGLLDIKADECVADFSFGEKNFVTDICFRTSVANYAFFNIFEESFNVYYYLRFALLGIKVVNDIRFSMDDAETEEMLYDKAFLDYRIRRSEIDNLNNATGTNQEWEYARRVIQLLEPEGKAVIIVPNVCTTTQKDADVRRWFVSKGYIEAVIALPEKMYKETNAALTMILLSHGNEEISFVDATGEGQIVRNGAKRMNELSEEAIGKIVGVVNGTSSFGTKVSQENILKNDSILSPVLYCIKTKVGKHSVEFQEVIRNITRGVQLPSGELDQLISEEPTPYKYLSPANIFEGRIQDKLPYLKKIEEKQMKYVANKGDIVISKNTEPFKVALVEDDNLLISSNMFKVEVDTEKIVSLYLKGYLESMVGQAELKKASSGGITTTLGIDALKKIQISCPPIEEQKKIVKEYMKLSKEINIKQKEIEELSIMRISLYS